MVFKNSDRDLSTTVANNFKSPCSANVARRHSKMTSLRNVLHCEHEMFLKGPRAKEIKCFKNGQPTSIIVDDFFPCSPNTGLPCYAHVDVQGGCKRAGGVTSFPYGQI